MSSSTLAEAKLERLRQLQELQAELKRLKDIDDGVIKRPWKEIARPDQIAPPGNWSVWCILAGRGLSWGKSRTAAEFVAEKARQYPGARIELVGKTFADVRDTMIEGESGLLACFSRSEFPNDSEDAGYNRSRLRVQLKNGSIFQSFSAEKPWRLRGPQANFCFPAGTMVRVPHGECAIESLREGDQVLTRVGIRTVAWTGSRIAPLMTIQHHFGSLTGTPDHPIWVSGRGWTRLDLIKPYDKLVIWQNESPQRNSMISASNGSNRALTTGIATSKTRHMLAAGDASQSIAMCGNVRMDQYHTDISFTIKTASQAITDWKIWNHSLHNNIDDCMPMKNELNWMSSASSAVIRSLQSPSTNCKAGYAYSTVIDALGNVESNHDGWWNDRVNNAEHHFWRDQYQKTAITDDTAVERVQIRHVENAGNWKIGLRNDFHYIPVLNAEMNSTVIKTVSSAVLAAPIEQGTGRVYGISVTGEHEYFADNVLVSNCWADEAAFWQDAHKGITADTTWSNLMITLRLPKKRDWDEDYRPQVVIATTPRPVALLRTSDPDPSRVGILQRPITIITRGRTMDNIDNLSKEYKENVIDPLIGTRLGRQELEAEILDDVPGAMWKRDWIEETRVTDPSLVPDLIRVVVAVDPAVSDGETSAQTGIVVAGAGRNGRGYVLGDFTLRSTPMEAMKKVVAVYHEFNADRVIAEVNQGGDFIGTLLKTIDPNIPYQTVRATRGKALRAEPVSSMYEQRRVSHCGFFPYLEDQMCGWTPGEGESPDRVDALTYSITALKDLIGGSFLAAYGVIRCARCQHPFTANDPNTKKPRTTCPKCAAPVTLGED